MNKKIFLCANWKMYLNFQESATLAGALVDFSKNLDSKFKQIIFPSNLALAEVEKISRGSNISVGPQNTYWIDKGGYTGEVSANMCQALGSSYALVGHSERRNLFHETNHDVRLKLEAVLNSGMTPILCVGETAEEKKAGRTQEVVEIQLRAAFDGLVWPEGREVIVAYEPVWAIGTGDACNPDDAETISAVVEKFAKNLLKSKNVFVLYGGSVRPENVKQYVGQPHINGVLVGGASAQLKSWTEIITAVSQS